MEKNILIAISFIISVYSIQGTELEIINKTHALMDVRPVIALGGKQVFGKMFSDIPDNSSVRYNSGIYKIVGCEIWLKYAMNARDYIKYGYREYTRQGGGYRRYYGYMQDWPPIDVFNKNALFVLDENNNGFIYPNKNNLNFFYKIKLQNLQYDIVGIEKEIEKEGWFLME